MLLRGPFHRTAKRYDGSSMASLSARWRLTVISAAFFACGFGVGLWVFRPGESPPASAPSSGSATSGSARGDSSAGNSAPWDDALGAAPVFVDVTASSGVDFIHENGRTGKHQYLEIMGAGVGVFDYDGDEDLDLYFVNGNKILEPPSKDTTNRLYRNDGGFHFTDVTASAGVGDTSYGQGCCAADYDGDGDIDLYVSNFGPNVLYRNNNDGTFTDVTAAAGVGDPGWGQTCSFLDYDRDGWLDLYVQNYLTYTIGQQQEAFVLVGQEKLVDYPTPLSYKGSASRLYRNLGNGTFRDVTEAAGLLRPDGKGMGLACVDFNDDGLVDIFVANDTQENYFFRGQPDGTFREVGLLAGVAFDEAGSPEASMGVDVADFDQDFRLDLIVPSLRMQVYTLYKNQGEYFTDVSAAAGLSRVTASYTGFNANFLDYDCDGDFDLFFTNGGVRRNEAAGPGASYDEQYGMPDLLLANDGHGRFVDVSSRAGPYFRERYIGRGSAAADLDNDGDVDLVICNLANRAVLLRNDSRQGHWLVLDLVAKGGRRQFPGTNVWIEAGGRRQRASVHGGVTYLSQGDRRVRFGLGAASSVDRLEIQWPDGTKQVLTGVAVDRVLRVEEGR